MPLSNPLVGKTREQFEQELLERLGQAEQEFHGATGDARSEAVQRYGKLLGEFNNLVMGGQIPEGVQHRADHLR